MYFTRDAQRGSDGVASIDLDSNFYEAPSERRVSKAERCRTYRLESRAWAETKGSLVTRHRLQNEISAFGDARAGVLMLARL